MDIWIIVNTVTAAGLVQTVHGLKHTRAAAGAITKLDGGIRTPRAGIHVRSGCG